MARFDPGNIDKFALDFEEIAKMPDSVIDEMLMAEGEVIRKGQAASAASMLQGPHNKGGVENAAKLGKVKRTANGKAVYVTFAGTQHGNRLAEIAFINEFGKKNQSPRQFIRTANEKYAEEAVNAAGKIYDNYLKSKGF